MTIYTALFHLFHEIRFFKNSVKSTLQVFLSSLLIDLQGKNLVSTPGYIQKFREIAIFYTTRGRILFFPGWYIVN